MLRDCRSPLLVGLLWGWKGLTEKSCFGLNMLTTLPLEAFVCREVMTNYYFPDEGWNPNRHLIFTTLVTEDGP